jgi:hypothetical protein
MKDKIKQAGQNKSKDGFANQDKSLHWFNKQHWAFEFFGGGRVGLGFELRV